VALGAASATGDQDARLLAPELRSRCLGLQPLSGVDRLRQSLSRTSSALFSTRFVYFVRAFGRVCQDEYVVASDLQKTAAHGHSLFAAALFDADHAW
jgi:hypothetical protein